MLDVAIAGAGIGGLTCALSLARLGLSVRVFEQVKEIRPLGVGINLLPHSVRHLFELGLAEALDATGIRTSELRYTTKRGETIWKEPRGLLAGYRWPQFSIHRGRLQGLLFDAVRERLGMDAIVIDHAATAVESLDDRAVLTAGGAEIEARLAIAADGIHSALRRQHYPEEGPPLWNGAILWRATTEAPPYLDGRTMCMCGHEKQKFVCYPITPADKDGRATINWIAERRFPVDRAWRREDWNRSGDLNEFLPAFADWHFPWLDVPALIEGAAAVYEYPMVDRDPLPRWSFGRMTLLGDAAHPMYPIGSNGASQAILDARALAAAIMTNGTTPAALAQYETGRRPKTSGIVLANRKNGPEQVMQIVEERAPDGFADLDAVIARDELEGIAATYKRLAGFDPTILNAEPDLFMDR
ncbi:MAG: flavin-dependent oxidoreductase [Alphaproteobacteria bacterium]|nr:flavin-dependent oxidoreductase [Alphaproteobacteria bacterium]